MKPNLYYYHYTKSTLYAPHAIPLTLPDWCESIKINQHIYFIGGCTSNEKEEPNQCNDNSDEEEHYSPLVLAVDIATQEISNKNPLKQPRIGHSLIYLENSIYTIGGFNGSPMVSCEKYNVSSDTWEPLAELNHKRYSASCCAVGASIYCIGGYSSTFINSVEKYENMEWKTLILSTNELIPISKHYSMLQDGSILLIGGKSKGSIESKVYKYNIGEGSIKLCSELAAGDVFEWGSNSFQGSVMSRNGNIHTLADGKWSVVTRDEWMC